jgi:hypothetical protein
VSAPGPQQPGGQLGYGLSVSPQGTIQKYQPGSAGVSSDQLKARDAGAVAQRTGQNESVQAGTPQSQEYLDQRAELNLDERLQAQKQGDAQIAAAQAESDLAAQQFAYQQKLQGEEAARQAALQDKYAREEQLMLKAREDYSSSSVEPNRIFANPVKGILAALAAAGGAYAAILGKSPNFAQQIIDQAIGRDIAAQEAAIRIKGETKDNLMSQLKETGMSVEQSRATAKAIQLQYYGAQSAALKAKNAVPALQSHYENIDLALQKSLAEANEQSRLASVDKVARSTSSAFAQPKAATAGGYVDVADQLGTAAKVQGLQKGEADIAKTNREANKPAPASPELRKVDQVLASLANDQKRLASYDDSQKPLTLANRGKPMRAIIAGVNDSLGEGTYEDSMYDDQDKAFIQDFESAKGNIIAAISVANGQGAMQEGERKEAEKRIAAAGTVGELKRAQAWLREKLEGQRQAASTNTGPAMEVTK